jgi:hypothetical protein
VIGDWRKLRHSWSAAFLRTRDEADREPRSGGISIAQGESANPGYAFKNAFSAEGASEPAIMSSWPVGVDRERLVCSPGPSDALSALGGFIYANLGLHQGYKYFAATRLCRLASKAALTNHFSRASAATQANQGTPLVPLRLPQSTD